MLGDRYYWRRCETNTAEKLLRGLIKLSLQPTLDVISQWYYFIVYNFLLYWVNQSIELTEIDGYKVQRQIELQL